MKIVAICGAKQSGKELVANRILEALTQNGYLTRKFRFSSFVRNSMMSIFHVKPNDYNDFLKGNYQIGENTISGKALEKSVETVLRVNNDRLSIKDVEDGIFSFKAFNREKLDRSVIVISDLRFKDEVAWCKTNNVMIVKVKRDTAVIDINNPQIDVDDFFADFIIENNSDEKTLIEKIAHELLPRIEDFSDSTV